MRIGKSTCLLISMDIFFQPNLFMETHTKQKMARDFRLEQKQPRTDNAERLFRPETGISTNKELVLVPLGSENSIIQHKERQRSVKNALVP